MRLDDNITQTQTVTTSNVNLAAIDLSTIDSFSVQIVSADASGSDAVLNLAVSNDGTNFDNLDGSSVDVSANGSHTFSVGRVDNLYVRAEVTASAGTVGLTLVWVLRQAIA